jgi:hypothetical protein
MGRASMIDWLTRSLMNAGSSVAQWFIPKDAVNFAVVAGVLSVAVLAVVVGVLALWPRRG